VSEGYDVELWNPRDHSTAIRLLAGVNGGALFVSGEPAKAPAPSIRRVCPAGETTNRESPLADVKDGHFELALEVGRKGKRATAARRRNSAWRRIVESRQGRSIETKHGCECES